MKAIEFFKLLGQIKDIKLVLETYIKNPDIQRNRVTLAAYQKDIKLLNEYAETLERAYYLKLEDDGFAQKAKQEDFVDIELQFDDNILMVVQMGADLIGTYAGKNVQGEKRQALAKIINAAFQIRFVILELLQNEHDLLVQCKKVDADKFIEIFERYKHEGLIPLIPEVDMKDVDHVSDTFAILPLYGEIKNHLSMTLEEVWSFVEHPLNGIEHLHKRIESVEFKDNFYQCLGEIANKYKALEGLRYELFIRTTHENERCQNLIYSHSSVLSDANRAQLQQFLQRENFQPHRDEDYQQFLFELSLKLGKNYTEDLRNALMSVYYIGRDVKFLDNLSPLLSQPMQRTMRYELTLKEITSGQKFDKIEAFLQQHVPAEQAEDTPFTRMQRAKIFMKDILTSLAQMGQAVNNMPRPIDEQHEKKTKILTLESKRRHYLELLNQAIDGASSNEEGQLRKSFITNMLSYKRAPIKKLWLSLFRAQLEVIREEQFLLGERTIEECLADEKTIGQQIHEAYQLALNQIPKEQQKLVFVGRTNTTLTYWEEICTEIDRIEKIVKQASRFSQVVQNPMEQSINLGGMG